MRRILTVAVTIAMLGVLIAGTSAASSGTRGVNSIVDAALKVPTVQVAGLQHWCGTNGVNCSDPSVNWDEIAGYRHAVAGGAPILPYIGHDEPSVQFFSNVPGSGNDVTLWPAAAAGSLHAAAPGRERRQLELPAADHVLVRDAAV